MAKRKIKRRRRTRRKNPLDYIEIPHFELAPGVKRGIFIVAILSIGAISFLSLFDLAGILGEYLSRGLIVAFGWGRWLFPLILFGLGYLLYNEDKYKVRASSYLGLFLFLISLEALLHLFFEPIKWEQMVQAGEGGGWLGYIVASGFFKVLGFWASLIILFGLFLIAVMLILNTTLHKIIGRESLFAKVFLPFKIIFQKIAGPSEAKEEDYYEDEEEMEEEEQKKLEQGKSQADPRADYEDEDLDAEFSAKDIDEKKNNESQEEAAGESKKISQKTAAETENEAALALKPPSVKINLHLNLLNGKSGKPTSGDIKRNTLIIKRTLENFGIVVEMGRVKVGPTVTQYTLKPAEGVKLVKITSLRNDLALSLAAHPIRIEAPIPGKSLVGVEVPNEKKAIVNLKEILKDPHFRDDTSKLTLALGRDVSGKAWFEDLAKMPHLIVAGATNSGKSVCLNTIIVSLLYQNHPEDLQIIMVDPKRVELTAYNNIPYLLTPVITDVNKTINALKWCLTEMDRRFDALAKKGRRNISAYNAALKPGETKMPYLIFIIDELADLMVAAKKDVEAAIIRLAQMARAVGIHLILATQRPSTDVITGLIKANMPARIAFAVASQIDSRTILDSGGAEDLLGQGDMLLSTPNISQPKRLQGAYLSDIEIKRVIRAIKEQSEGETNYIDEITASQKVKGIGGAGMAGDDDDADDLLGEAKDLIINTGKASASLLQRRLSIGYARAARILDLLEEQGVVGPSNGSKPREIMVSAEEYEAGQAMPTSGMPLHNRDEAQAPDSYLGGEEDTPPVFKNDAEETIEAEEEEAALDSDKEPQETEAIDSEEDEKLQVEDIYDENEDNIESQESIKEDEAEKVEEESQEAVPKEKNAKKQKNNEDWEDEDFFAR